MRFLAPNTDGISEGYVLHITGRMGPDPFYPADFDGSAWQGLMCACGVIQEIPQDQNILIAPGSFTLTYVLTAADIAAQLSIGWNAWGDFGDSLTAGENPPVISVDDMMIIRAAAPSAGFMANEVGSAMVEITGERFLAEATINFADTGVVTNLPAGLTATGTATIDASGDLTGTLNLAGTPTAPGNFTVTVTILGASDTFTVSIDSATQVLNFNMATDAAFQGFDEGDSVSGWGGAIAPRLIIDGDGYECHSESNGQCVGWRQCRDPVLLHLQHRDWLGPRRGCP